ncbi:MAG TPA: histidine phosphatase family protein [Caulobacteraceae bacterium]|nr:histidine phosphatase family protein [Caulobacteraceae bacterium]
MTTLILVRHARATPDPSFPERDWPLSEAGQAQALALAPVLAELGVDALASSPFVRAIETLRPYADATGLEIAVDEDLRERALGGWIEDLAELEEAIARMHADLDFRLEGGESGHDCNARFDAALARVAASNPGRTIAVGSHGGVLGHLLARHRTNLADRFWKRISNPHLFVFDAREELRWVDEHTLDGAPGLMPR